MNQKQQSLVQQQFGASADRYADSCIHARGESLSLLLKWAQPHPNWRALDIATGAGHTALAFAPHVASVVATDITEPMLQKTRELARQKELSNIQTIYAEAESLPFDDRTFDLVTCRLAMHHFSDAESALLEMSRVLKPDGRLGFTDNVTVSDANAAKYYNRYERIRDPSHRLVESLEQLLSRIDQAGFALEKSQVLQEEFEFESWAERQNVSADDKATLLTMMQSVPPELKTLFATRWADETMYFRLWEAVVVAKKN